LISRGEAVFRGICFESLELYDRRFYKAAAISSLPVAAPVVNSKARLAESLRTFLVQVFGAKFHRNFLSRPA